ncbi:hypothetical protein ES332_D07G247000v1 [Gossypium tomentosum]|uniref:Uncharacterized protein n=1 Tax=Gossypium tomentosum TaxID=34277 RepID=A0A5D2KBZ0_GOSTO|nr:hypothetical protein ES332_D07G247000v1 [Gossypium tomentosum]
MAPRRTDNLEMEKKQLKVRAKVKQLKAEMRKIREDQRCIREEQIKLTTRFEEIERQCHELKQEVQMIAKQSAMTRLKMGGDLVQAATLTRFLGKQMQTWLKSKMKKMIHRHQMQWRIFSQLINSHK